MNKKVLIEEVDNGFLITEDYKEYNDVLHRGQVEIPVRKVFNTHKQLNKYLNENIGKQPAKPLTEKF